MADIVIRRRDAKLAGMSHYFTGTPCSRGHVARRLVSTFQCCECAKIYSKVGQIKYREYNLAFKREYWVKNKDALSAKQARTRKLNPEKYKERDRLSRIKRADKIIQYRTAYREQNREAMQARDRANWHANRERSLKKSRAKYQRHAKKRRAETVAYREKHPERCKAWSKAWFAKHPEVRRVANRRRKALLRGASGSHTADDIADIKRQQKQRCAYCRVKLQAKCHVDHIHALSRGGSNDRRNLQILCQPCNQRKSAKDPIDFAQQIGRLL